MKNSMTNFYSVGHLKYLAIVDSCGNLATLVFQLEDELKKTIFKTKNIKNFQYEHKSFNYSQGLT